MWEVGDSSQVRQLTLVDSPVPGLILLQISKAIDRVAALHTSYSIETINRCSRRPTLHKKRHVPEIFEDVDGDTKKPSDRISGLDIRILDQETIEMASMFYRGLPWLVFY